MEAFALLCRTEGIIPAIESAHALAGALRLGQRARPGRRDPGQPLRPRGQGHGHRGAWFGLNDGEEVERGPPTRPADAEQQPTEGAVCSADAVSGAEAEESA